MKETIQESDNKSCMAPFLWRKNKSAIERLHMKPFRKRHEIIVTLHIMSDPRITYLQGRYVRRLHLNFKK